MRLIVGLPASGVTEPCERQQASHAVNSDAFKDIQKLESDFRAAADRLRANSKLTSSEYFMPVLGVILLHHAARDLFLSRPMSGKLAV